MKILMVGLGGIGQRHVRNLRSLMGSEMELLAFRSRNKSEVLTDQLTIEAGSILEKKYAIQVYKDLDQALAQRPDAVFVCNPTSLHIPIALKAAQAGCHLFIEKPLSHNFDQVEELIHLVDSTGIKAVVGYQMRFHPCLQRLHNLIQQKTVGRILSVRAEVGEYLPNWHTYEDYRQLYASRKDLGGGVILTQIHELDYLYWLFGLPHSVYALGGHLSHLEVDVEDTAEILMEFGVDGRSVPVSLHQDYLQRPPSRGCVVIGDAGKIVLDFPSLTVNIFDGVGKQVETSTYADFQRNQMFLDEVRHFLSCLNGPLQLEEGSLGRTSLVTVNDAAQSLRMALAAKRSLQTGEVVALAAAG